MMTIFVYQCRFKPAHILTASNSLASSLEPGDQGLEPAEAVHGELSLSKHYLSACRLDLKAITVGEVLSDTAWQGHFRLSR